MLCFRLLYAIVLTTDVCDACARARARVCVCVCMCVCMCVCVGGGGGQGGGEGELQCQHKARSVESILSHTFQLKGVKSGLRMKQFKTNILRLLLKEID